MEIGQLAAMLDDRADVLARALLPLGRREGPEWVEARRAQGGLGDGLRVIVAGSRKGFWKHFGTGDHGDMLDLVALTQGLAKRDAVAWARAYLGIDTPAGGSGTPRPPTAEELERRKRRAEADEARRRDKLRGAGQALFLSAREKIRGTPVERYLAGRGLGLAPLRAQPRALRFHAGCRGYLVDAVLPAMLAAISGPGGEFFGVHRTWLVEEGGRTRKARLEECGSATGKATLGPYAGGCIRLWNGARSDPKTGEILPGRRWADLERVFRRETGDGGPPRVGPWERRCVVTEGIEDGLAMALAVPEIRVLVAVSLSNMGSMILPAAIDEVTIAGQDDGDNEQAARALGRAFDNFHRQGKRVRYARPPAGMKDPAEVMQASFDAGARPGALAPSTRPRGELAQDEGGGVRKAGVLAAGGGR